MERVLRLLLRLLGSEPSRTMDEGTWTCTLGVALPVYTGEGRMRDSVPSLSNVDGYGKKSRQATPPLWPSKGTVMVTGRCESGGRTEHACLVSQPVRMSFSLRKGRLSKWLFAVSSPVTPASCLSVGGQG